MREASFGYVRSTQSDSERDIYERVGLLSSFVFKEQILIERDTSVQSPVILWETYRQEKSTRRAPRVNPRENIENFIKQIEKQPMHFRGKFYIISLANLTNNCRNAFDVVMYLHAKKNIDLIVLNSSGHALDQVVYEPGSEALKFLKLYADMETEVLGERTRVGLLNAKKEGKTSGKPRSLTPEQAEVLVALHKKGRTQNAISRELGVSQATVSRYINETVHGIKRSRSPSEIPDRSVMRTGIDPNKKLAPVDSSAEDEGKS